MSPRPGPSPSTRRAWIEMGQDVRALADIIMSPSTRRAWIEMGRRSRAHPLHLVALHPEGVDRNRRATCHKSPRCRSPSTRRAWIEIQKSEDRAFSTLVALHPEGVDRNAVKVHCGCKAEVALHPEGVDRNFRSAPPNAWCRSSPSTRRAWIEMFVAIVTPQLRIVALHPEGVDRNITP